ncbi:MAG: DGQHR domain-containing protein [SAR324 cluster bacterium]|nr:DGQHR domain-containing protein [SAR324 cluster bacterium]
MTRPDIIDLDYLEVRQPLGTFYVAIMNCDDLETITYADIRRLEKVQRDVELFSGIQRELDKHRAKKIGAYVNMVDSSFPNSIIVSISSEFVKINEKNRKLEIKMKDNVAKVIDGQHRIAGLEHFTQEGRQFQLIVAIFVDMEVEDEAMMFSTINRTHNKVSQSLASDLYAFATTRSPHRTAHNIIRILDQNEGSAMKGMIKILGSAIDKEKERITQATFAQSIIQYISMHPDEDRDRIKRGKKPESYAGAAYERYFLRDLWIDEKDSRIMNLLNNYFLAVKRHWPEWGAIGSTSLIDRSTGFVALMRFLPHVYKSFSRPGELVKEDEFYRVLEKIDIKANDINRDNFPPGTGGQVALYKRFLAESGLGAMIGKYI